MNAINTKFANLHLRGIELNLHLGWSDAERAKPQSILLDVMLYFPKPPLACTNDNLSDTYCYDTLIQTIIKSTTKREFHLIEHLAAFIYDLIQNALTEKTRIHVSISKDPRSYIPSLTQGVVFSYGDKE